MSPSLLYSASELISRQAPGVPSPGAGPPGLPPGFIPPTPEQVQGPIFVGVLINYLLLGTLILQVHRYTVQCWKHDTVFVRSVVYFIFALDLGFSIAATQCVWEILISGWGQPQLNQPPSAVVITPSAGIMGCFVQMFFAWRIWKFNGKSWLGRGAAALIAAVAVVQAAGALTFSISWELKYDLGVLFLQAPDLVAPVYVWLVGAFANDIIITSFMVFMLIRTRRQSKSIPSTVANLNWLIIMSIETGAVTSVVATLDLILYAHPAFQGLAYHTAIATCLGKFYSNMLLANLNGRSRFQGTSQASRSILPMSVELQAGRDQEASGIRVTTTVQDYADNMAYNGKERNFLQM